MKVEGLSLAIKGTKALKDKMQPAASLALNRVGKGVVTEASRKVKETYNIKSADVKNAMRLVLSSPDAGEVLIKSKGRNLPVTRFKVTPKAPTGKRQKMVKVAIKRGDAKKVGNAFVAVRRGAVGIMKRQKPTGQSGRARVTNAKGFKPELPIEELHGPAIQRMLNEPQVVEHIQNEAQDRMEKRLIHEINRILK
ncbi:phage tail protein [Paenibacillus sp. FSL R5-0636]|uniref:phage tail protein n=1 Tax=Paenibacillus TaxID=44249 RepID=UPI00096EAE46|nr:phage tail protein [Paenibacillus odorifer]OMD00042.1 hypothetical protein BJP49_28515 [Paenibacillus odorifer]OMD29142.1 hypothetical protein BJP48_18790 [Paenibacillus odorifer]